MRLAALLALALAALILLAGWALADPPAMDQQQMLDYIAQLFQDRADLQIRVDKLRLDQRKLERELDAEKEKTREVDEYWKRWTGVK